MLKGIDISHHQKGLNLSKIDFDFVIIKATEGIGYVDECCDGFFQQALKLGKKIGFYHFARPVNDAVKEAQYFYSQTKNYFGKAVPVLDWEMENRSDVAWRKRWLDEVYRLSGVKPIIYMSLNDMRVYDWTPVVNGDYGLWIASYGKNPLCYNYDNSWATKPSVKWWSFCAIWQWGSQCRLNGWSGNLDVNIFYGDASAWDKYAGIEAAAPSEPTPKPTTPTEPQFEDSWIKSLLKAILSYLLKVIS